MKKRVSWLVVSAAIAAMLGMVCVIGRPTAARAAQAQPIDMYLIAGQSNAVGYSTAPATGDTFSNVMYAGQVNCPVGSTSGANDYLNPYRTSVTKGLGRSAAYIGPEYGMAKVLDGIYTADHKAMIFKSAAGGTSLRNLDSGQSGTYGNWLPPSARAGASTNSATGVQYDNFVKNFKTVYNKLVADGYAPRVKGMIWMQGEADRAVPNQYKPLITQLIADIRSDLSTATGDDLSQMPFVMGEISDTFGEASSLSVNRAFNAMLHSVTDTVSNTAVIASGPYAINADTAVLGTDRYHWNTADMYAIGQLFGQQLLTMAQDAVIDMSRNGTGTLPFSNGAVQYSVQDGSLTLTPVPHDACRLDTLLVNGAAVTLNDGRYTAALSGTVTVQAEFTALTPYNVSYKPMGNFPAGEYNRPVYGEGQTVVVKVTPPKGYVVKAVTFNGAEMTYDAATDTYSAGPITGDSAVAVTFTKQSVEPTPEVPAEPAAPETPKKKGCGSELAAALSLLSAVGLGLLFVKRA